MGRNEVQSSIPNTNDIRGFRRLRKGYPDYHPHCVKRDAGLLNRNVTQIPDAISEKSVYASSGGFTPSLVSTKESTNSGSSNDDPVFENESSEDISSGGPPSPFLSVNATRIPLGIEAMRGNDFSNTVFIDDISPSDEYISAAHNDFLPPVKMSECIDLLQSQCMMLMIKWCVDLL
ncbi:hypothetical protein MKX03_002300 [Papaver bracteatum]|nr:hypothetical protein MKX03_002300 [Papaver bracteatum]